MKVGKVQIGDLRIRGLAPNDAQRLGRLIAERLARSIPGKEASGNVPDQNVRITGGGSLERMADEIAARVGRRLDQK